MGFSSRIFDRFFSYTQHRTEGTDGECCGIFSNFLCSMTLKWDLKTLRELIISHFRVGYSEKNFLKSLRVFYSFHIFFEFFTEVAPSTVLKIRNYLVHNKIFNERKKLFLRVIEGATISKKFF